MGLYIVLTILIVGCCLILLCFRIIGVRRFRKEVQKLAASADVVNDELEELYLPTHLLEAPDIEAFKEKHHSLLQAIDDLKSHKYYHEGVLNETGLGKLLSALADSPLRIAENNKVFYAISELKSAAGHIIEVYHEVLQPTHYFAYSELYTGSKDVCTVRNPPLRRIRNGCIQQKVYQ